jgi:hypothetical protein
MFIRKLTDSIIEVIASGVPVVLFEVDQRHIVKWIWENRPDIIRDIVCADCNEREV